MHITNIETTIAVESFPIDMQTPIAASIQIVAAEVTPITEPFLFSITPAPRKPIPVITCPIIRVGSDASVTTEKAMDVNKYVPRIINADVRIPTGFPLSCLSRPIINEQKIAVAIADQFKGDMFRNSVIKCILG